MLCEDDCDLYQHILWGKSSVNCTAASDSRCYITAILSTHDSGWIIFGHFPFCLKKRHKWERFEVTWVSGCPVSFSANIYNGKAVDSNMYLVVIHSWMHILISDLFLQ